MAAVLAALRRMTRPAAAAALRRLSGVPDEIAELQRASVAALSRADASGDASARPLQEPGPEDCCVRARGRARGATLHACVPASAHSAPRAAQNRGCANCVWTTYTEGLAQERSRADNAAAPAQAAAEARSSDDPQR